MARRSNDFVEHGRTHSVRVLLAEQTEMSRTALVRLLSNEDVDIVADLRCDPKVVISTVSRVQPDVTVVTIRVPRGDRARRRTDGFADRRATTVSPAITLAGTGWPRTRTSVAGSVMSARLPA